MNNHVKAIYTRKTRVFWTGDSRSIPGITPAKIHTKTHKQKQRSTQTKISSMKSVAEGRKAWKRTRAHGNRETLASLSRTGGWSQDRCTGDSHTLTNRAKMSNDKDWDKRMKKIQIGEFVPRGNLTRETEQADRLSRPWSGTENWMMSRRFVHADEETNQAERGICHMLLLRQWKSKNNRAWLAGSGPGQLAHREIKR
jgi:hypothetical protein